MIKKITTGEYLKDYRAMTAQEREAYRERVGEWLRTAGERLLALTDRPMAKAQNLMSMSARWTREDCEAAHEGSVLLTALMAVTETWLPSQLWVKSAWRAVRQITGSLSLTLPKREGTAGATTRGTGKTSALAQSIADGSVQRPPFPDGKKAGNAKARTSSRTPAPKGRLPKQEPTGTLQAQEKTQGNPATKSQSTLPAEVTAPSLTGRAGGGSVGSAGEDLVPARPKHIDQYAYLLPKGTQERAGAVRGLLRELDEARENMRLLMEDANAKPDARAAWAKRVAKIDGKLKGIYKELDAEWEKLVKSGRVTVDALGNAGLSPIHNDGNPETGAPAPLTSEQKARRRELRKWLIDLRRGKEGEARKKRIEQWKENWKEYLTLEPLEGALKDEKVVAAAKHFGISLAPLEVKSEK